MGMRFAVRSGTDLGRAVRALRRARRLSQADLAELAGLSPAYVSKIESGRTSSVLEHELRMLRRLGAEVTITYADDPGDD